MIISSSYLRTTIVFITITLQELLTMELYKRWTNVLLF